MGILTIKPAVQPSPQVSTDPAMRQNGYMWNKNVMYNVCNCLGTVQTQISEPNYSKRGKNFIMRRQRSTLEGLILYKSDAL